MASQTSDTPNGPLTLPPTAGLPADPLPLLLKVIPAVPSPPEGCGTAPAACMPHPTSCLQALLPRVTASPGMALEEPLSPQPPVPAGSQGQTKLGSTNQPYCWGFWQGAILPFTQICFSS